MGCYHKSPQVSPQAGLIRLLLTDDSLLQKQKRPQLTAHVLGKLQANASDSLGPRAVKVASSEIVDNPGVRLHKGEVVADISYSVIS